MSRLGMAIVSSASTLLLIAVASGVSATPGTGVTHTILAKGTSREGALGSGGEIEVTVYEVTIAPGGSTGWHYHDGELVAVVKFGTLTRQMHDCSTVVTGAGASFVEPAGRQRSHVGRNLGTAPVVLLVTYVLPAGMPLSQDAPEPQHCH
jgi:quercetin dioxygenase-like cupin family protein